MKERWRRDGGEERGRGAGEKGECMYRKRKRKGNERGGEREHS
jgi:hypothetical protein